jgi:hypothetical protein
MDKVKKYTDIFDILSKNKKPHSEDTHYLLKSRIVVSILLANFKKLLAGKTTRVWWNRNSSMDGIATLANAVSTIRSGKTPSFRDKELANKIVKEADKCA